MKKMCAGLMSLVLVMAVFTTCGSKKELTFSITITPPKSYVDQTVHIKTQNEEGLSDAYLIYPKGTMIPMKKTSNSLWELDFVLPAGKVGKINLEVVGKPSDGSPAITQSFEYEIMENPTISAKVVSDNPDGTELEVKTSKPFKKVYIQTDDNKQIIFESKGDNTYKLKTKELDLDNKGYAVNLEDESGNILKTNLIYTPDGLPMMYNYNYWSAKIHDPNTFEITEYYGENPRDNPYKKLKIAQKQDLFMDSLPKEILVNSYVSPKYLSMSPSKKHLLMNTIKYAEFSKNHTDSTGQILKSVKAVYSTLYDLETGKYEFIGEPYYYKEYKNPRSALVFKEEGPLYYFMRWEGDNLFLLEQRKDPRMMYDEGEGSNVQYGQSILATARIVLYSITKKTTTVTNQKPVTPWLTFSDQWTGIQGWGLANTKNFGSLTDLPSPEYDSGITDIFITSFFNDKKVLDYNKLIPESVDNCDLAAIFTVYTGLDSNKPFVIIVTQYSEKLDPKIRPKEGEQIKSFQNTYKLFMLTGELIKLENKSLECIGDKDNVTIDDYTYNRYLKDYCKYFTIKDGKIISKYRCDKYINPIESFGYIN